MKIIVEKKRHHSWELRPKDMKMPDFIGEWQYIYSSEKGKISLVYLPYYNELIFGNAGWEIAWVEKDGNACEVDVISRYTSKEEAEKEIKELLKGEIERK